MQTLARCAVAGCFALSFVPAAEAASKGNATAGRQLFEKRCQRCHTIERLAGLGDRIRGDMGRINTQMSGLGLLWEQEVVDLRTYINSIPRPNSER